LGADAYDLIDLAREWGDSCPDAVFASVNAPDIHYSGLGRQWWAVTDRRPEIMEQGARAARRHLDAFLDAELARLGLGAGDYALMGFSQGAMAALFNGLRRATPPRAILAYSGALIAPGSLAGEITHRPPVYLVHGEDDPSVPASRSRDAEAVLLGLGVPVTSTYIQGLGHGIDDTGLAMGRLALSQTLG